MTARKNECARFESVWDAICDTPQQAQNMKLRAELMHGIRLAMQRQNLSQAAAARLCGVTAPRMSDLVAGRINKFSLDALVNVAAALGLHLSVRQAGQEAAGAMQAA